MHRNVSNVRWLAAVLGLALAGCGSDSTAPSGRPAAGQIAFTSDRDGNVDIYLVHADGSGVTRLTNNPARDFLPVWSSDGTRIAFYSERDGNGDTYVMNADGSGVRNLTNNPASDATPAWSPDDSTAPPQPAVASVAVAPSASSLTVGDTAPVLRMLAP